MHFLYLSIFGFRSIRNVSENQKSERHIFWLENQKIIGNLLNIYILILHVLIYIIACFFAKNLSGSCVGFRRKTKKNTCRQCQNLRGLNFVVIYIYMVYLVYFIYIYIYTLGVARRKTEQSYIYFDRHIENKHGT